MTKKFCDVCGELAMKDVNASTKYVVVTGGVGAMDVVLSTRFELHTMTTLSAADLCKRCRNYLIRKLADSL